MNLWKVWETTNISTLDQSGGEPSTAQTVCNWTFFLIRQAHYGLLRHGTVYGLRNTPTLRSICCLHLIPWRWRQQAPNTRSLLSKEVSRRTWLYQSTRYHIPDDVIFIFRLRNPQCQLSAAAAVVTNGRREMSDYHGDGYGAYCHFGCDAVKSGGRNVGKFLPD